MFGQPKPLASLSSGLLARKGQARPAMRPQGFGGFGGPGEALDDLGWNDMGDASASEPTPAPAAELPAEAPVPPVLRQREALEHEFAPSAAVAEPEPEPAAANTAEPARPRIARAPVTRGAKAAFTLRLDAERHLRLRLASATRNRSAQLLVTEALDQFLATLPEIEELARQCAEPGKSSGETR
ncbi:hypothetical protein [Sphingomonas aracearum]|nr:hypothetical protein [Sphingomonas aracearum]